MKQRSTIFIIDDDPSVRRSLRRLLAAAGYDVIDCGSAQEFLALRVMAGPTCLVTDVRMPGMTGLDLIDAMRRSGSELPVILSSGDIDAATVSHARRSGAIRFLRKPFTSDELFAAIEAALDSARASA